MVQKKGFRRIFIFILIAGAALFLALLLRSGNTEEMRPTVWIKGAGGPISVIVADTPELREKGLSGHPGLSQNEGMFFIFNASSPLSFWMKDMFFPIDIIWIGADWKVVDITVNLTPETYPNVFSPKQDAQYVLEVPAGFAQARAVIIGQSVHFKK